MSTASVLSKRDYLESVCSNLRRVMDDRKFGNYKKQVQSWRMGASFKRTYDEAYLWDRAVYLSTNAGLLLSESSEVKLAVKCLQESAQVFEYLGGISERFDKDYSLLLASLSYDLAGYQANALCLTKKIGEYELQGVGTQVTSDNYVLQHVTRILLKNIPGGRADIRHDLDDDFGIGLFNDSIAKWYDYVLDGRQADFLSGLSDTYAYYLNSANLPVSQLLFLLRVRLKLSLERSTWTNLRHDDMLRDNPTWTKYIKLLSYDAYSSNQVKPLRDRTSKFELWTSQLRSIEKGLLRSDENFVVQMPTSAGKTFIAELSILKHLIAHPEKKCIYIAPFRALTNEKEREIGDYLSKLGFSVSALSGSYEMDEFQQIVLDETDVLIATPEKIDLLLRVNASYFSNVSLIVVDEGQIVGDVTSRASLLEFLITRLKIQVKSARFLFISAVMPFQDANNYSTWLSGVDTNVMRSLLHSDSQPEEQWEPTRKLIGSFTWDRSNGRIDYVNVDTGEDGTGKSRGAFVPNFIRLKQYAGLYPRENKKAETSASLCFELSKDGNCLVFCAQVEDTRRVGEALLKIISAVEAARGTVPDHFKPGTETESHFFATKWYGTDSYVSKCLEHGIGIHYGDMPEPVRRSVESDYRLGVLKVLISTSTVGQGLNFPIKHLVVHSTIMGYTDHALKTKVRDFWNIVGRAGRAGKETEGQIIFVINTPTDRTSFKRYADRSNIESAHSILFLVLNALVKARISEPQFDEFMQILSEPYLLSLLAEEAVGTEDEKRIEEIIDNSLFKIQAAEASIDLEPVRGFFTRAISNIRSNVPNPELLATYGQTGFMLKSNQAISEFIAGHREVLEAIVSDDRYLDLTELVLQLFDTGHIQEVVSDKLTALGPKPSHCLDVVRSWIAGADIEEIQAEWRKLDSAPDKVNILISDGLYYRYTWAMTAFITILCRELNIGREALPANIRNLPSYIKFGLNTPVACLARSLGIKNRNIAIVLADHYSGPGGRDFIRWLANLTYEDLTGYDMSQWDRQNILETALKLSPRQTNRQEQTLRFDVRGTPYSADRVRTSLLIRPGARLSCARDSDNIHDPYAIRILHGTNEVGFVPRELSKMLSTEIDVNGKQYRITVAGVRRVRDYNSISVELSEESNPR